jgi:hypothetical protein
LHNTIIATNKGEHMNELIGKTVTRLRVNEDQSVLAFDHPDGSSTAYATWGDCCSETWFADITGVSALLGARVLEVEAVDLPEVEDNRSRQNYDRFYGVKLRTSKGFVDIVYRNSSNGYYGGGAGLYDDAIPETMTTITDDWQA